MPMMPNHGSVMAQLPVGLVEMTLLLLTSVVLLNTPVYKSFQKIP
jgi:hypothetical protein